MEKHLGQGAQGGTGEQQAQENLVFSFPGYKTPTQAPIAPLPIQQVANFPIDLQFQQPVAPVPYAIGQSYLHSGTTHLLHNANFAMHTTPPTLGQIASRIKEKASASKQSQQEQDDMDVDGPEEDDEDGEEGDGEDNDGEGAGGGGGDQTTGRWTKKEHDLFLAALKKYGKVRTTLQRKNLEKNLQ